MEEYDIVIIGGGPAGLSAAISAKEEGIDNILLLERDNQLGGILNQCIHSGFGLQTFKEELTGPEYAQRLIDKLEKMGIKYKLNTTVLDLTNEKIITIVNENDGILTVKASAVILATGCRERSRGVVNIPGSKSAGIFTVGAAQKFVNLEGYMPGKEVVILGSGDLGLVMARRMSIEGAKVKAVLEPMSYCSSSKRNIVQCLDDFGIPLKLSYTVIDIKGKDRVEGVTIAKVDDKKPIKETEEFISCDTLLLSVGLLPEDELLRAANIKLSDITGGPEVNESLETSEEGIFACGNVLHVQNLVDYVSAESANAGRSAARYVRGQRFYGNRVEVVAENGVRYVMPRYINPDYIEENAFIRFRVDGLYKDKLISVYFDSTRELSIEKEILIPGEIETIRLTKELLDRYKSCQRITINVENK